MRGPLTPAVIAALLAGASAALMYSRTLLPGLDLGDTASFQTVVTLPALVPRHAYPLYFALGKLFVRMAGGEPAYAMNVLSAAAAVAAVSGVAWFAWSLTGRGLPALWSALLFAGSYTFWSQAVIAEVYTLEALFIALVLIAALAWFRTPTAGRLAWLYAVYALSFGNHLSMILLAPALVWLLWLGAPRATLKPFSARGIALAVAIAAAGAGQYAWNFAGLWTLAAPRPPLSELLSTFWFDVTKSDWRATLVGTVPLRQWGQRVAMYRWDLQQQFGLAGIAVALIGLVALLRSSFAIGVALVMGYLVTFAFAFIYNVGDTHVFLLPSHQVVAAFAACGAAALAGAAARLSRPWRVVCLAALLAIPLWRIADTWPAVDRSGDRRAERYVDDSLAALDPATSVYIGDLNWQTQNAVGYELTMHRPQVPRAFVSQVLWHFPDLVRRNGELGRDVVLTQPAADAVAAAYGSMFQMRRDTRERVRSFGAVGSIPRGTPYVIAMMTPLPELVYDQAEVARIVKALAGVEPARARYTIIAGLAGSAPLLHSTGDRPFRASTRLSGHRFDIRIESWLPFDTMRRAGFGHVIVDRRHAFTLERGANVAIFTAEGQLRDSTNQGGSFAVQPRYVVPVLR